MYDKGKIILVLIIFVGLITFPFFYNAGKVHQTPKPSLNTKIINQMSKKQCVKPANVMMHEHMKLLNQWRDDVVRKGNRDFGVIDGVKYEKSLQKTCMHCHSNKKDFCDSCHTYAGVREPYCWQCHILPKRECNEKSR